MSRDCPYAYNAAQRIVSVAKKCAKKPGLFSNPASHLPDLDEACIALLAAIEHHALKGSSGKMTASEFMSIFSEAHPNWQNEYDFLNRNSPYFSKKEDKSMGRGRPKLGEMSTLKCPSCGITFQTQTNAIMKPNTECSSCVLARWRTENL